MRFFGIDPGPTHTAYVLLIDSGAIFNYGICENNAFIDGDPLLPCTSLSDFVEGACVGVEMIASYGMPVGKSVFDTCIWIGRFLEHMGRGKLVTRNMVKLHHCHSPKAKDANVRQAMIDRFGQPGTKKRPGATYGITKDVWQALAVAAYALDNWNDEKAFYKLSSEDCEQSKGEEE